MRSSLVTVERSSVSSETQILIIDKKNFFAKRLAQELSSSQVVVVTSQEIVLKEVKIVGFKKSFPEIPNRQYAYMFIVYQGDKETLRLLPDCIKKSKRDRGRLIFIVDRQYVSDDLVNSVLTDHPHSSIAIVGDTFDTFFPQGQSNQVTDMLYQAAKEGVIKLSGMGLKKTYPIYYDDAVEGILRITFGAQVSRVFLLGSKHGMTELHFAHTIQKVFPLIKIDFYNDKYDGRLAGKDSKILNEVEAVGTQKDFSQKIRSIQFPKDSHLLKWVSKKENSKKEQFSLRQMVFLFLGTLILLPLLCTSLFSFVAIQSLFGAKSSLERGDFFNAKNLASSSIFFLNFARATKNPLFTEATFVGLGKQIQNVDTAIETSDQLAQSVFYAAEAGQSIKQVIEGKNTSDDEFNSARNDLRRSVLILQKIKTENKIGVLEQVASIIFKKLHIESQLNQLTNSISIVSDGIDILPGVLGMDKTKSYLVLMQNNTEIRPTGGFIGSYALVDVRRGNVISQQIHDVYDADGQLKAHVEPPFALRRYLPVAHWFLRDSNFDPEFARSASMSAFFLKLETGKRVDGVIGIDVSFVQALLKSLGTVYVPEYSETVTPDNMYLLMQIHAEKNFFPGSTQKKDFMRALFNAMLNSFTQGKVSSYSQLALAIKQAMDEKHILFASADPALQEFFSIHGLSNTYKKQNDRNVIGISEANLGANKANLFVKRAIDSTIAFGADGTLLSKITVTLQNDSSAWPGGDYKLFLRAIVPKEWELISVLVDKKEERMVPSITDPSTYESKNFSPPQGREIETNTTEDALQYGSLFIVPSGTKKQIEFVFTSSYEKKKDEHINYGVRFVKQPGTGADPVTFSVIPPEGYKALSMPTGFLKDKQNQELRFSDFFNQDYQWDFSFTSE